MVKQFILSVSLVTSVFAVMEESYDDPVLDFFDTPYMPVTPPKQPDIQYVLRVRFPTSIRKFPRLCGYYKGYRLNFNSDYCLINEKTPSDSFTLVITDDVTRRWQNNTTKDLKRAENNYRMFHITKKHTRTGYTWNVEEEEKTNIPCVLPKASIVFIFDPDLVKGLITDDGLHKIKSPSSDQLYLPIIELTPDVTAEKLKKVCDNAWCAAPDTRGIHSPVSASVKNEASSIVAMHTQR